MTNAKIGMKVEAYRGSCILTLSEVLINTTITQSFPTDFGGKLCIYERQPSRHCRKKSTLELIRMLVYLLMFIWIIRQSFFAVVNYTAI